MDVSLFVKQPEKTLKIRLHFEVFTCKPLALVLVEIQLIERLSSDCIMELLQRDTSTDQ